MVEILLCKYSDFYRENAHFFKKVAEYESGAVGCRDRAEHHGADSFVGSRIDIALNWASSVLRKKFLHFPYSLWKPFSK